MSSKRETWRNRIVGMGEMEAGQLLANPGNFRIHPQGQQRALAGSLDTLGWVDTVLVNKATGFIVDGHARVTEALRRGENTPVPVLYVDLTPKEEAQALLSLDPIAAMAATDRDQMAALMQQVQSDDERVTEFMSELAVKEHIIQPPQPDYEQLWQGMPEFENEDTGDEYHTLMVHFASASDLRSFSDLVHQTVTEKSKYIWYPKRENLDLKKYRSEDES